ncbi:ROK family transcriptional regulator [Halobacillus salinarum]|uniref:ROK family transcriptional regulator n=1 Tax=Halobacillus salinarum TaxID=2932257 RepID=A0ABY4EI04_9BACI|nr:ROK family transcriptional regulator [Halobacillus salinarum]UOQ44106.1 ROK family transcriptional regulator [Halobacillus salinarum]
MPFIGQNTLRTKQLNRSLVFQSLLRFETPSRQEIASFTQLTPATITNIIAAFKEEGIVVERGSVEKKQRGAGRKTVLLDVNENSRLVAGVHVRSDRVELGIVSLKGNVLETSEFSIPQEINEEDFLQLLVEKLTSFLAAHRSLDVSAIGVGAAGLIDFENGLLLEAEQLGWKEVALVQVLQHHMDVPVFLDHHVRGMALAEKLYGSCKNETDYLCVFIGQGIGSGLCLKDEIYRSNKTGAGELGHMVYQPDGIPCWCGNKGCLEGYASEEAVRLKLNARSIDEVVTACKQEDEAAWKAVQQAGSQIGTALVSFVNMVHVNRIVIGGKLAGTELPLLETIHRHVNEHSFLAKKREIQIESTSLGSNLGVIGAASIALLYGVISAATNYSRG